MNTPELRVPAADRYSILGISEQHFAVEVINMKEVIPLPMITPVPNVNECILGVFNLRGQIYSIFDLRVLLKLERNEINEKNFIVLLEWHEFQFGVVVDRVLDVTRIDPGEIQIPTRELSPQYISFLNGYYEHETMGVIYLLDLPAILQNKEIIRYRY